MAPRRVAFINEKGGSGKTTLAANMAAYLALRRGRRVLAIDLDPQGQLGKVLGLEVRRPRRSAAELLVDAVLGESIARPDGDSSERARDLPALPTRIPNLDVVVANKSLALFPGWTRVGAQPREPGDDRELTHLLRDRLDRSPEQAHYDYVFFDAPPSFGPFSLNILRACDEVVVPVPLTFLALDGFAEFTQTLTLVRERYEHPDLRLTMVVPTFHRRTRLAREILDQIRRRFPKEVSQTVVGYHVKIDEAQSRGLSIFEHAPRDRSAETMAALAEELESRGEVAPNALREGEEA